MKKPAPKRQPVPSDSEFDFGIKSEMNPEEREPVQKPPSPPIKPFKEDLSFQVINVPVA